VQDIAKTYISTPLAAIYQDAADKFRIPYWDWASIPTMPDVVNQQSIQITTASGVQTVENPLFQ
jgi:tyrosinase